MKNLAQFGLVAALCGMFAACGSDSSSNSSEKELPESIKNFSDIADYECNAARQCAKLYIEEYDDYMQCADGSWETVIETMPIEACAEATNSSSSSVANCSSSGGIPDSDRYSSSSSSKKLSSSSNDESGKSQENGSSSSFSGIDPKGTMTDTRDGKIYKTVTIGEQTWMAENLNYAYNMPTAKLDSSSFCYNNEPDSCSKYGRLYLWSAAMDSSAIFSDDGKECGYRVSCETNGYVQGVCPEGWHLPDTTEWRTLFSTVGGTSSAGTMLKSISGWYDDGNGEDSFGFSVLPAGYRYGSGGFDYAGNYARFWSSSEYDSYGAYYWDFDYYNAYVYKDDYNKSYAFSVRCVRDSN